MPVLKRINPFVALTLVLIGLAITSSGLNVWQWITAIRFPLHKRESVDPGKLPAVTLLKPLKGCDSQTLDCFESWFQQDYPAPVQILFGVASPDDPVCEVVRSLIARHPRVDAHLEICSRNVGVNAKVSTLTQLEALAKNSILIISDADVLVPEDFLSQMATRFSRQDIGLVNCFYRLENIQNAAMQWEAIAINADFWSQVLQGNSVRPMDFALGAVMGVRRESLQRIGGFVSLADDLADDYQLGNKIAEVGEAICLMPVVACCRSEAMGWREVWNHQLRWARTIRVCQPVAWFCSILGNVTFWSLFARDSLAESIFICFTCGGPFAPSRNLLCTISFE